MLLTNYYHSSIVVLHIINKLLPHSNTCRIKFASIQLFEFLFSMKDQTILYFLELINFEQYKESITRF